MGFSDDQRPDVNSGDFILLQYKPSTLLEYLFYELRSTHYRRGPGTVWSPVRLSDWLLQSCQADCLASVAWLSCGQAGCFQVVRLTALLLGDPMVSGSHYTHTNTWVLALVWPPTGLALPTGQWAVTIVTMIIVMIMIMTTTTTATTITIVIAIMITMMIRTIITTMKLKMKKNVIMTTIYDNVW